jgi:hypothetical protein
MTTKHLADNTIRNEELKNLLKMLVEWLNKNFSNRCCVLSKLTTKISSLFSGK